MIQTVQHHRKQPREVDVFVGRKVRARRMALGMSQERLGEALGLTFQQVQKYEKGTNRIAASRLAEIADVLQVEVASLFPPTGAGRRAADDPATALAATRDGQDLAHAFARIACPQQRRAIVRIAEACAGGAAAPQLKLAAGA